jgi:predicted transcriptional regulator
LGRGRERESEKPSRRADGNGMKLRDLMEVVEAELIVGEERLDLEIEKAFASDLMSDVLAFATEGSLLLTGLTNAQVVRTAEMVDLAAILFVRGKRPQPEAVRLAQSKGIPLLTTPFILFETCGRLYCSGIVGSRQKV